jgi:hypothetical protein
MKLEKKKKKNGITHPMVKEYEIKNLLWDFYEVNKKHSGALLIL